MENHNNNNSPKQGNVEKPYDGYKEMEIIPSREKHESIHHITGTVELFHNGQQRLVPIPSSDPLGA
jgi:hypothetical protein